MNFIDICAGIGGFRSGLELAGHECKGFIEIDKYARKSYEAMYDTTNEWTAEDIKEVKPNEIPNVDLWCFGFPCQDISVAGKQKGLKGERSGIFYSIIELLKGKSPEDRPKWILAENVKNLLSLNGGREFTEVLSEISQAGYDCEWHLVNSKDFGVPQNRERVFIIGHLRGDSGRQILPLTGTSEQISSKGQAKQQTRQRENKSKRQERYGERFKHMIGNRKYQNSHVYGTTGVSRACDTSNQIYYAIPKIKTIVSTYHQSERIYGVDGIGRCLTSVEGGGIGNGVRTGLYAIPKQIIPGNQAHRVYDCNGTSVTIKAEGGGVGAKTGLYAVPKIKTIATGGHQRQRVQADNGLSRTLTATDYKEPQPVAIPCLTPDRPNKRQNGRRFKEPKDPMFTLTAQDRHGVLVSTDTEVRPMLNANKFCCTAHGRRYKENGDTMFTLTACDVHGELITPPNKQYGILEYEGKEYNIRRLTPKECFRLQGFTDEQFEKAQVVNSNSQLYKQAGNAVTVNVAYLIGLYLKKAEEEIATN